MVRLTKATFRVFLLFSLIACGRTDCNTVEEFDRVARPTINNVEIEDSQILEYAIGEELLFSHIAETNPHLIVRWNFGDGNSSDTSPARHTYTEVGEYTVEEEIEASNDYIDCFPRFFRITRHRVTIR